MKNTIWNKLTSKANHDKVKLGSAFELWENIIDEDNAI